MENNGCAPVKKATQIGIDSISKLIEEKNISSDSSASNEQHIKDQVVDLTKLLSKYKENQQHLGTDSYHNTSEAINTSGNAVAAPNSSNNREVYSFDVSGALPPSQSSYSVLVRPWEPPEPDWKRLNKISDHIVDHVISRLLLLLVLFVLALSSVAFAVIKLREIPYNQYEKYLPEFLRE